MAEQWRNLGRGTGKRPDGVRDDDVIRREEVFDSGWYYLEARHCAWLEVREYQLLVRTPAEPDVLREKLGEALFALSDKLRSSNFFDSSDNHAVYERVVAAFTALAATEPTKG